MATVSEWVGLAGQAACHGLLYDNTNLFASFFISPAQIVKIDRATMTTIDTWVGTAGQDGSSDQGLTFDGTRLYTCLGTYPAQAIKIDPTTAQAKPAEGSIASRLLSAGVL
jgi:hypothetical protein